MKQIGKVNFSYRYDAARKGAKYSLNGAKWMNGGDFAECVAKALNGLEPRKDGNVRFDVASDIPEFAASVKSSKASLTNMVIGSTFEESIRSYFERTVSRSFWYVVIIDDIATIYKMNAVKFERFIRKFGTLNERGVIRFATTSSKMLAWLDANV